MNRKIYYWKLRESEMQLGERALIMGVLNITPDSFSDGGRFNDPDRAYARALELEEQGADIIDLGAESTKPGSQRITADEEWQRLVPVLKLLRGKLRAPLSLDTYKSEIAVRALPGLAHPVLGGPSRTSSRAHSSESGAISATPAAVTAAVLHGAHTVPDDQAKERRTVVQVGEESARTAIPKGGPHVQDSPGLR